MTTRMQNKVNSFILNVTTTVYRGTYFSSTVEDATGTLLPRAVSVTAASTSSSCNSTSTASDAGVAQDLKDDLRRAFQEIVKSGRARL